MNYELAKQLKDAGFPGLTIEVEMPLYAYPTLSELIEACGDGFTKLKRQNDEQGIWYTAWGLLDNKIEITEGDTMEEAVAHLWLALNTKN